MTRGKWIIAGCIVFSALGGYWYWTQQTPEEEPTAQTEEEITREQTEAHMRQIGYVQ